jgi:hypothetical protein
VGHFFAMKDISKLLIPEPPLQILPSLAIKIGLNEAIVLQQLHYLLRNPNNGRRIAEEQWIFNTIEEWVAQYFPFWSVRTMQRVFTSLAEKNLICTCQPEGRLSRRKYYRINEAALLDFSDDAKMAGSIMPELRDGKTPIWPVPIAETSSETSVQRKDKGALAQFRPLVPYPEDEEEMIATLEEYGVDHEPDYDGNFFTNMSETSWMVRGKPVYDWIDLYAARVEKIKADKNRDH